MSQFKIEKNVAIPKAKVKVSSSSKRGRKAKYPFDNMEIGDSFKFPATEGRRIFEAARAHGKRKSRTFEMKVMNKNARIWRIS